MAFTRIAPLIRIFDENKATEFYVEFLQYWTAPIQKGNKKGMELWMDEKTFSLASRLATSWNTVWKNRITKNVISVPQKIVASTQQYEKPIEPTEEEKLEFVTATIEEIFSQSILRVHAMLVKTLAVLT